MRLVTSAAQVRRIAGIEGPGDFPDYPYGDPIPREVGQALLDGLSGGAGPANRVRPKARARRGTGYPTGGPSSPGRCRGSTAPGPRAAGPRGPPGCGAGCYCSREPGGGFVVGEMGGGAVGGRHGGWGGAGEGGGRGWGGRRADRGRDAVGFAQRHAARGHDLRHCAILAVNQD